MNSNQKNNGNGTTPEGVVFVKSYTNRWGQEMRAEDYGKQAFVFFPKAKKSTKKHKRN